MSTPRVPDLHRERVGVRVRGDGQEPVRPAVQAAPYLRGSAASVLRIVMPASANRTAGATGGRRPAFFAPSSAPASTLPASGASRGPPVQPSEDRIAERQQRRPPVVLRRVEQHHSSLVGIALARRAHPLVHQRGHGVGHRAEQLPGRAAHRRARRRRFDRGEEPELRHEAVVVGGELAVDPGRERVVRQLALKQRAASPAASARSPGTTGTRSWRPAARPPRRSRGCSPTSPWLSNAARYSWCQRICRSASSLCSKRSATGGQSSSSRLIQAKLISRTPSSMPLVQLTPDRNGFSRHQDRSCSATRSA